MSQRRRLADHEIEHYCPADDCDGVLVCSLHPDCGIEEIESDCGHGEPGKEFDDATLSWLTAQCLEAMGQRDLDRYEEAMERRYECDKEDD
jgi:hypothetical protein